MRKICIINQKGGVGKTTTTVNLGAGLSRLGKKVLIIDLDPQGNVAVCLDNSSYKDMYDFLMESAELKECVQNLGKNLDIITSKETLTKAEQMLVNETQRETFLRRKLKQIKGYDYVLLDCPPSLGLLNLNALLYANEAFIPVSTDVLGMHGLRAMIEAVNDVAEAFDHDIKVTKIIPTLHDRRNKICVQMLTKLKNEYYELVSEPIMVCSKLKEAPASGKSIFNYAKSSQAAKDYLCLVNQTAHDEMAMKTSETEELDSSNIVKKLMATS